MSIGGTLLTAGLTCIIAAIVGGGLKAFGIEIGALQSVRRQALLAGFGAVLIAASYIVHMAETPSTPPREVVLFDNGNDRLVYNNPPKPAEFEIARAHFITSIQTYHWNDGAYALPGNIGLRHANGRMFGPWEANLSGGGRQRDWLCRPEIVIPPGRYTIIDSEPATWSWNPTGADGVGSGDRGISRVKGIPVATRFDRLREWLGL
jgi:hypothetical protein